MERIYGFQIIVNYGLISLVVKDYIKFIVVEGCQKLAEDL